MTEDNNNIELFNEEVMETTVETPVETVVEESGATSPDLSVPAQADDLITEAEPEIVLENEEMPGNDAGRELLKNPAIRASIVYQNYIETSGRILSGKEKRALRRKIMRETLKGKYDYMFDEDKIAARERRREERMREINK